MSLLKLILLTPSGGAARALALFSEDFDWKDEMGFYKKFGESFDWKDERGFYKKFGESFDWKEEWSGSLIFTEDFSGWP